MRTTEKLKIKTFVSQDPEEIDELVNSFRDNHDVVAIQSHMAIGDKTMGLCYIVFFKEKE